MGTDPDGGGGRSDLFRPAAVSAHAASATGGKALRSSRRQLTRCSLALAVGLAAMGAAATIVEVDETAEGWWRAGPGGTQVVLPIGALPRLHRGQEVRLGEGRVGTVTGEPRAAAAPDGARAVVDVRTDGRPTRSDVGPAVVRLDRRRLAALVADALGRG